MEKKQKKQHGTSRSFTGAGLVAFLRSTVASFSSTFPASSAARAGRPSSFNHRTAFSGPIVSIVPPEARAGRRRRSGYRTPPEPSSPKVSCIGQIKRSNSRSSKKVTPCGKNNACPLPPRRPPRASLVKRMLLRRSRSRSRARDGPSSSSGGKGAAPAPAPGLGQMKRFKSGRAAFQDFDWREEAERRDSGDYVDEQEDEDDDEGFVAHSAPLVLGGGVVASEPRKEVNLWRRRLPMSPPTPLQLP